NPEAFSAGPGALPQPRRRVRVLSAALRTISSDGSFAAGAGHESRLGAPRASTSEEHEGGGHRWWRRRTHLCSDGSPARGACRPVRERQVHAPTAGVLAPPPTPRDLYLARRHRLPPCLAPPAWLDHWTGPRRGP